MINRKTPPKSPGAASLKPAISTFKSQSEEVTICFMVTIQNFEGKYVLAASADMNTADPHTY
jgi:hypothetical protein